MLNDPAGHWDLLQKQRSDFQFSADHALHVADDKNRISFVTHTGMECVEADEVISSPLSVEHAPNYSTFELDKWGDIVVGQLDTPRIGTREVCENVCLTKDTCAGFQFTNLATTVGINN